MPATGQAITWTTTTLHSTTRESLKSSNGSGCRYRPGLANSIDVHSIQEGKRPSFITLYFSDVDTQGHLHGPEYNPYVASAIKAVDRSIGTLIEGLAKQSQNETNIVIVSDHGMTATRFALVLISFVLIFIDC